MPHQPNHPKKNGNGKNQTPEDPKTGRPRNEPKRQAKQDYSKSKRQPKPRFQ